MKKTKVGILFGGRSGEHEVSISSATSIVREIDQDKYDLTLIGITQAGVWVTGDNLLTRMRAKQLDGLVPVTLLSNGGIHTLFAIEEHDGSLGIRPLTTLDVIFPVLHGSFGEDGAPQGMLEMLGIPYVGAGVLGSAVIMDKALFKDVMRAHGLPVLESRLFSRQQILQDVKSVAIEAEALSPYPLFPKPVNLGSSVGISRCANRQELIAGLLDAARYDLRVLVERGLTNPVEVEVSVLGNSNPVASLPGQIVPSEAFYSYRSKYLDGLSQLIVPANLPEPVTEAVRQLALQAYQAVDCAGMARADFLIDPVTWSIYISELNTIPGFTAISMYPRAWEATGLSYGALIDRLIELALERKADRDQLTRVYDPAE